MNRSDRTRWMDAMTPVKSENPDEKIYEEWGQYHIAYKSALFI